MGYDQRHQIASVGETLLPNAFTASYSYNDAGRFVAATESSAPLPNSNVRPRNVVYHYDGSDPEQITSLTDSTTSAVSWSYTYDASGNQTLRCLGAIINNYCTGSSSTKYMYDGNDRLRRVVNFAEATNQGSEEYYYDSHGTRYVIVKRDGLGGRNETIWFIGDVEAHYDDSNTWTYSKATYGAGAPIAQLNTNSSNRSDLEFEFNGLSSNMLAAIAADGTVNAALTYAPFGEVVEAVSSGAESSGLASHPNQFNGKYLDSLSELTYYGNRYYDRNSMSWTQNDPLYLRAPDAANTPRKALIYQFSLNNPMRYVDSDGLDSSDQGVSRFFATCAAGSVCASGNASDGWDYVSNGETWSTLLAALIDAGIAKPVDTAMQVTEVYSVFAQSVEIVEEVPEVETEELPRPEPKPTPEEASQQSISKWYGRQQEAINEEVRDEQEYQEWRKSETDKWLISGCRSDPAFSSTWESGSIPVC